MNDMYPLKMLDLNGDAVPDIFEQDLNGDGKSNMLLIDADHDGFADVTIHSDAGFVHAEPQAPGMAAFVASVSSPDFAPGFSPAPDAPASDMPAPADGMSPILNTVAFEDLPKFPGSLDHGRAFDGRTWETLGGSEDFVAADLSGDGNPDIFGIDFDGDGITDIAGRYLDTDGDGVFDAIGIDCDQDGQFDFFERMT